MSITYNDSKIISMIILYLHLYTYDFNTSPLQAPPPSYIFFNFLSLSQLVKQYRTGVGEGEGWRNVCLLAVNNEKIVFIQ